MHTSLCLLLRNDSAKRHIFGCSCSKPALGLMTPKFEIERDFGTMHIATKFHHPTLIPYTFNRSEVMVLTNKPTTNRTPLWTSTSLDCATPVEKNSSRTFEQSHC